MGGQQTSTTNQTQTQTANPVAQAALTPFGQIGLNVAQTPYNAAMNPQVAAQNQQQLSAIQGLGGLQSNNPASPFINQANQYSQTAADPNNVTAMAQQFYNPMSQQVLNQLGNVFGQQSAQLQGNEAASGSIGGSRASVANSTLANQQGLAAGQTLAGLQQQALNAAQTQQGQISQQAFTQGQLGNEALNTGLTGINAALQGGNLTQAQQQAILNAAQQGAIQQTLFPQQEAAAGENIAMGTTALGGTTTGQGTTTQPVNYLGQVLGAGTAAAGLFAAQGGRIHRAIGGGTGVGLGDQGPAALGGLQSGGVSFGPIQSGLAPHFAQSPQVQVPQSHFPTINLNPQQNTAQQQQDAQAKQFSQLGTALGKSGIGSSIADSFATPDFGGGSDFARGGRIHRGEGGGIDADPNSIQAANDAFLGDNQGFGLGAGLIPPANAAIAPSNQWQPSIEAAPQKLIQDRLQPSPPAASTMGAQSAIPGPGAYFDLDDQGRRIGAPQSAAPDPALAQKASIAPSIGENLQDRLQASSPVQQAAIASPAQAPAPIAQPAPPPLSPHGVVQNTVDTFRGGGASDNAIRGILTNYNDESGFNPGLRHPDQDPHKWFGESRYAHGLAQEGGAEWNRYTNWLEQNGRHASDWSDPNLQNQFLLWNLKTNYPQVWGEMNNAPTAEQSAQAFLRGYLKPSFANQERRAAQYERGIPGIDDFVNNAGTKSFGTSRSVLNDPSLQPPKPGDSYLDRTLAAFGINLNQPQGLGGSLGRALGQQPLMSDQNSNRLVNMGLGMMASGPSVGVKGFPGAAISALTSAGKGGQFALNQEQQERTQAINLANAAMNQKLHETQIAHQQFEMKKPFQIGSSVQYFRDPITQQMIAHNVTNYGTMGPDGKPVPLSQDENMRLNGISGGKGPGLESPAETVPNNSDEQLPAELRGKGVNLSNPVDAQALRIISGQASMPSSLKADPAMKALQKRVYELDPTYNLNRAKYYEQYGGPNGKTQTSYNAFGTALTHAGTLDDLNHGENVTDLGWNPINWAAHGLERSYGESNLESYEKTARAYGHEHERTLTPTGPGTGREREEAVAGVSSNKPLSGRLSGNAANVEILLGKLKKLDDAYDRNMGVAAKINKPQFLTDEDKAIIRKVFAHEPDRGIQKERYDRLSKDPRTADLVSPPPKKNDESKASGYEKTAINPDGHRIGKKNGQWFDVETGELMKK